MTLKEGLFHEDGKLIYYKNGAPEHAGVIQVGKDIYYIGSGGKAVKGQHIVHGEMANDILKRGTYTFGEDYKLVAGSYIAPKKHKKKHKKGDELINKQTLEKITKIVQDTFERMKHKSLILPIVVLSLLLVVALWITNPGDEEEAAPEQIPGESVSVDVKIALPEFSEDVLLCTKSAKLEYDGELPLKTAVDYGDPYRPFRFEYSLENCSGTLFLSDTEGFADAKQYELPENGKYIDIHNLKVNTDYSYMVVAGGEVFFGEFHTAESTRFVYIPGLKNTRDIGGRTTLDGKTIKQGLLIRGVELDGLVNAPYYIPNDQLEFVQNEFGFAYDLDLREATIYNGAYSSRLGVPHQFYTAPQYGQIFTEGYKQSLRRIFADLADPEKYPMYLHCTWGRDRTGTIIFLLQGILNLSEEDMKREYLLTSYVDKYLADSTNMDVIISGLAPYEGDTVQEKIVTFLTTEIGVTEDEIASIRSIFLED